MADIIYRYDGSFDGLLCCVFEAFSQKETPSGIFSPEEEQGSLYPEKWIETVPEHAARVYASLPKKMSQEVCLFIRHAFLTCLPEKELFIYRFVCLGYRYGARVMEHLTNETVHTLERAVKHLQNEAHLSKEFLRFSEYEGALVSVIHPKNTVLPLLSSHFCTRFPNETFVIFDETHHMALVYRPYQAEFLHVESFSPPQPGLEELQYRALWKRFFKTTAVEGRINPKCQMTHMPKRYWQDMLEVAPNLLGKGEQNFLLKKEEETLRSLQDALPGTGVEVKKTERQLR